jgi:membrane protein
LTLLKTFFQSIYHAIAEYKKHNPLALASSTAFFSLFALPPILIIVSQFLGTIATPKVVSGRLFTELSNYFGEQSAEQVEHVVSNFQSFAKDDISSIIATLFFIFVATTLMKMVKDSINLLWGFRPKTNYSFLTALFERFLSVLLLFIAGILFLLSLISDSILTFLSSFLLQYDPELNILSIKSINALFSILSISVWFSLLFRTLPNAKSSIKPVLVGGFFTAILFTIGKYILGRVLINSSIDSIFGASGSAVLLLLFVFYSSLIFYFGAVFTKIYATAINQEIKPGFYAVKVNTSEVKS